MNQPLVSVIVTTRNNEATLDACLASIAGQTYQNIELLVVDNQSKDKTKEIAAQYTTLIFDKGPERSTQRNFAVEKAKGNYVFIIDSDMELGEDVVAACVEGVTSDAQTQALIIPEQSFGQGFWAQCKRLERSFYLGQDDIEAARFFSRAVYEQAGGYDEAMVGGEDWDLTQRVRRYTRVGRVQPLILHNEGRFQLRTALRKKFYYARGFATYYSKHAQKSSDKPAASVFKYYKLYLSRPVDLLKNPFYGLGMLFMKTCEFGASAMAYAAIKFDKKGEGRT